MCCSYCILTIVYSLYQVWGSSLEGVDYVLLLLYPDYSILSVSGVGLLSGGCGLCAAPTGPAAASGCGLGFSI